MFGVNLFFAIWFIARAVVADEANAFIFYLVFGALACFNCHIRRDRNDSQK